MIAIVPYLKHRMLKNTKDKFLLRESLDRRTRIFGTLLGEIGYPIFERAGYNQLRFHLHNPGVSKRVWNLLYTARQTAEEWAGFYKSEYELFIQAQISVLNQESLKGLWSRMVGGPIRTPPKLVAVLMACRGEVAGYRYRQFQSDRYNVEADQSTDSEVDIHNTELLKHLARRWGMPTQLILLQTYRSGIFTSGWIQQHPEFQLLVVQGLAEPSFINDYNTKEITTTCLLSTKRFPLYVRQNSHSL